MKNLFNSIQLTKPKSNVFDLSHDVKLSLNMGELIPIMLIEAVPGDKFNISCESLLRFAPLISPVMHRMDVTMHYFFVPNRILWNRWEEWITNTKVGDLLPSHPFVDANATYSRLHDYLGIPTPLTEKEYISAMPFAAYQCIYNEYYRDQNLITEVPYKLEDGDNSANADLFTLRYRAWEHDYFTACLPWAQKGESVSIPLGDVQLNLEAEPLQGQWKRASDYSLPATGAVTGSGIVGDVQVGGQDSVYDPNGTLNVSPTSINELRRAFRLQEWLEKNARGGTRYIENILSHFGVKSSDKRLQRPEYITGTKSPVVISEVLNTTGTNELPQGNMAGHAVSVTSGHYGDYFVEEHGYILGIMSVMPKPAYMQGIARHWQKYDDPTNLYWPSFANIGEQEVKCRELYAFSPGSNDLFGYIPRYSEYKYEPSRVAGDFRTNLDFWHLARDFAAVPNLNSEFIECKPSQRIFAVTDPDIQKLYAHVFNKVKAVRRMPKFGTPNF